MGFLFTRCLVNSETRDPGQNAPTAKWSNPEPRKSFFQDAAICLELQQWHHHRHHTQPEEFTMFCC